MVIKHDVSLKDYTTLKIGGNCKNLFFPETIEDIQMVLIDHPDARLLGGGSNLLINDQREFLNVICLRCFLKESLEIKGERVTVGAGVRLQNFISKINANGLGGIEYLFSVPGLVGGAIYMNAGRGRGANKQISDYLVSVDVLENGCVQTYLKDECGFAYRTSIFQTKQCIILKAVFSFDKIDPEEGKRLQKERIETCRKFQDNEYPNAGTTFCQADSRVMGLMKKCSSSKKKEGIHFSSRTSNWLQNRGNGTYQMAIKKIRQVELLHKFVGKECKLEYIIWE